MVTKWYKLFLECPSGFKNIANDLSGSQEFTELGEADITKCEAACNDRSGCTAFEFNHAGEENYKCGTYTGGVSDILTINTGGNSWSTEGYQKSTWTSCYKGISSTSSYYYHYYYYLLSTACDKNHSFILLISDWFPGKKTSADGSSNKISARRWF